MSRRFGGRLRVRLAVVLACAAAPLSLGALALRAASAPSHGGLRSYATAAGPVSVAVGDLNGDGEPDLVTANLYANTISVFLNRGGGSFKPRRDYRAGGDPRAVAIRDLNGDGKPDLATVSSDANALSVFLNKGDGSFGKRRDYDTGVGPLSVAIGDLNGDGKTDIATAGRSYALSAVLNSGNGRFKLARQSAVGAEPVSLAIGDLNGDGKPDAVTANAEANTVSVLLNRRGGHFQGRRDYATGRHPMAVAIGDLNGDGKPDLVTANLDANTISVFINRGDGSFKPRRDYRGGGDPRAVAIGDLNRDGKPDIVTVNAHASTVSVLLDRGHGSFGPPRSSGTGRHPVAVTIGNLDGDGRPEVVTANLDAGTASVLRARDLVAGTAPTPPAPPPTPPSPGLLLWNKLGSAYEVTHSTYGPNLVPFDCKDPTTPHFSGRCEIDVPGKLAYPQGVFGGAAAIGGGPHFSEARVHTAMLRASILNPEHGAVEVWYRQEKDPVPFEHDQYRIFGGPYSLVGIDEVNLYSSERLHFALFFGEEPPPFVPPHLVDVRSLAGVEGYPISALNGQWIHVAGVWDRKGIAGTTDTVRLYVNGKVVAASKATDWGTTPCGRRVAARPGGACFTGVAGCNDTCANTFAVDNLKAWNYAKTDYSDRFSEGP
jgi:hypothetical protein